MMDPVAPEGRDANEATERGNLDCITIFLPIEVDLEAGYVFGCGFRFNVPVDIKIRRPEDPLTNQRVLNLANAHEVYARRSVYQKILQIHLL